MIDCRRRITIARAAPPYHPLHTHICLPAVPCCAALRCVPPSFQELQAGGKSVLVAWSPTHMIRVWESQWRRYRQQLLEARARRQEVQLQRRMHALGLPA